MFPGEFVSDVALTYNGSEDVKVGSWLFIHFMGAGVVRGIPTVVLVVCVDICSERQHGGGRY